MIELLGWTRAEWDYFNEQRSTYKDIRPGEPTAFLIIPFLIKLVIGIALTYAASLLTPRPSNRPSPRIESRTVDGQSIVQSARFAPTAGFDSQQNVVELGSIVPVIFAKRETIDGITYGGIRINTNLLWSQLYSLGGSQLIKAMFMVGFGPIGAIDPHQFAIGDNLLSSYDLGTGNNNNGRLSFYFRPGNGRIRSSDLIAGRAASADIANSENAGAGDVFQIRSVNGVYLPDFCYASKPSSQTAFGLYAPIGNDLAYRINPGFRSISIANLRAVGKKGDAIVECSDDNNLRAVRDKQDTMFSTRSGIVQFNSTPTVVGTTYTVSAGDSIIYILLSSSDYLTEFAVQGGGPEGSATSEDVAQSISGLQRTWDDSLAIGELYRIGSCVAVLESRSPLDSVFVSEADNTPLGGGVTISCTFRVVRPGSFSGSAQTHLSQAATTATRHRNGTDGSHVCRLAVATFATSRPAQVIEIGFRSTLGINIQGLCNFPAASSYAEADAASCKSYSGNRIRKGEILRTSQLQSGTSSSPEVRYSFFRLSYRIAGSDAAWISAPQLFGFRSSTSQPSFSYLRVQFPSAQRWECELMPVSGWEIRSGIATGDLEILEGKIQSLRTVYGANCVFEFNGVSVPRNASTFALNPTQSSIAPGQPFGPGLKDGDSYADAWGKLAEQFVFSEITATTDSPEHEISYVNIITRNTETPLYNNIAKLGATIRSGQELRSFQQLSVYINLGVGSTHLIGDVLRFWVLNPVAGLGEIISPAQVDDASFDAANTWTYSRRYFFDGGVSEPFNFRQQAAKWAEYFLHDLLVRGGKFYMQPIALFGEAHKIQGHYTSGNVSEFEFSTFDPDQRTPPRTTVKWREEKQAGDLSNRGLFPVVREVTVRESGTPEDAPLRVIDLASGLNNFCTSELHAIDVGKMECRKARLITSGVKITTRPDRAAFDPGKIIKIGMETVKFNLPQNGVILADGTVISKPDPIAPTLLADGSYSAMVWSGSGTDVEPVTMIVANGKCPAFAGSVYSLANNTLSSQTYKVQKVDFTEDGDIEAEATEFPLDENNFSLLTAGWDVEQNWIIEGRIGSFNDNIAVVVAFQGVTIAGPSSVAAATTGSYSSSVSGPAGSYSYSWSATGSPTIATPSSPSTTFSWAAAGSYVITLSVLGPGSVTKTKTLAVTVVAIASAAAIGAVTVSGPTSGATGALLNYTATHAGAATGLSWFWSTDSGDPVVIASGNTADIRFLDPGTYVVRARASGNAPDSPRFDDLTVTITGAPVTAIDSVSISGDTAPTTAVAHSYIADFDGNATGVTWGWSVSPAGPTLSGSGAFRDIIFPTAGSFTITATATDAGAVDSPRVATLAVAATV